MNTTAQSKSSSGTRITLLLLITLLVTGGLFMFGWNQRRQLAEQADKAAKTERSSIPVVNVARIQTSPALQSLLLPGNITALTEAFVYARASGYVSKRYADIGDRVNAGQVLAELDAPDLDQQVSQARANVAAAEGQFQQARAQGENQKASLSLAQVTWDRYRNLLAKGAIARQDADQQETNLHAIEANLRAAEANVAAANENIRAARANVDRLVTLQDFKKIRAPFAGVVTARNFDIGALVSAAGSTPGSTLGTAPSGGELFRIAQFGTLRILINVPQENIPSIQVGQPAEVLIKEFPGQIFAGKIARTNNSVDLNTRTMLVEVQVPNPRLKLLPGMYAEVRLESVKAAHTLLAPGDSVVPVNSGLQVAMLTDIVGDRPEGTPANAKRVHFVDVRVGRDYGQQIEVLSGLQGWEYVVVNPGDVVHEGAIVNPVTSAPKAAPGPPTTPAATGKGGTPKP